MNIKADDRLHGRVGKQKTGVFWRRRGSAADGSRPPGFHVPWPGDGPVVDAVAPRDGRGQGALDSSAPVMVRRADGRPFQGSAEEGFVASLVERRVFAAATSRG